MGDKFKISELKSQNLINLATCVDKFGGDDNGAISKAEAKKMQDLLNGEYNALKPELADENDDIKKVFGYTGSVKSTQTTASQLSSPANPASATTTNTGSSKKDEIKNAYYRYRGIDSLTRKPILDASGQPVKGLSPKEAYEAVKAEYKNNKEYKKYIKDLEAYSIDAEAKMVVIDAVSRTTANSSKEVKKQAEAILKSEGNWDKHTKKALNGNTHSWWKNKLDWLSGTDSDMKLIRKAQASGNKAEDEAAKIHTKKDFTDAIGKKSPLFKEDENGNMAIENLKNLKGEALVTKKNGGYDISKLVEFIGSQIGADNTMNRQQNSAEAELEKIRTELRKQGIELTKRDTRQLIEFCGYRVEHKNWVKAAYNGTIGALAGGAGTLIAMGTERFIDELHLDFHLKSDVKGTTELIQDAEVQKMIEEGSLQVVQNGTDIRIKIDKTKVQPFFNIATNRLPLGVLKAAGVGALIGIATSLLEFGPSEKAVFSTNLEPCRTYEDFIAYVDARKELTDAQKMALKQIAIAYIEETEDGKAKTVETKDAQGNTVKRLAWDYRGFIDYLNSASGFGSNLNKIELFKAVADAGEIISDCDCDCDEETPVTPPKQDPVDDTPDDEVCEDCETKEEEGTDITYSVREEKFRSWQDLVNGYDCLKPYNKVINGVALNNRMVKVIQAIDISSVRSLDDAKVIYNIQTIAAFAEDAIRYGIDRAIANHPELPVNKNEYNAVLNATAGLKGNAYVPALYDPDTDDKCEWSKKANAKIIKGGSSTATLTRKSHTVKGEPTYWRKCPGSKDWEQIDKATYDALQKK